ncbi:MAG: hypothetical protein MJZ15_05880 [Bacteroidales bacterium]|nr:hypothetical protein [Bacteroidales bacterium]
MSLTNLFNIVAEQEPFAIDTLSWWFIAIVTFVFAAGAWYGKGYLGHYESKPVQFRMHWLSYAVTYIGMMVLFTTNNMLVFLLGWELMAIGSFFAVIFENEKPLVLKAGINYFIQSHVAVLLITAAFGWAWSVSGLLNFDGIRSFLAQASEMQTFVFMMMLVAGFGFKAGIIPFHSWLPHAHPSAPSHVSAVMSGVIVKAGIYGIVRFASMMSVGQTTVGVTVLILGVMTGLYGILNAAVHRDFKRMLAYCTIENIGIITMGIGVGLIGCGRGDSTLAVLGFAGALLHTLNHAIFKALLFFGAGNVYVATHTRNMEELGGLIKVMPQTAFVFLIGSLAIGGLPPFGGFVSEFVIYGSFLDGFGADGLSIPVLMALSGASLAIIGGVSMLTFTKSFGVIFLGEARTQRPHVVHEVKNGMLWPSYLLMLPMLAVMLMPTLFFGMTTSIAESTYNLNMGAASTGAIAGFAEILGKVSIGFVIFAVIAGIVVALRFNAVKKAPTHVTNTWGCGYGAPIKGIQYTSKSFARTLIELFKAVLPSSSRYKAITTEEIFPKDRSHMSADSDFWENSLVNPITSGIGKVLDKFQFIQNGDLQRYIVYGLGYILLLVASATLL